MSPWLRKAMNYCFDISLELLNICRSTNNEFNVYNLSEILQLKKTANG